MTPLKILGALFGGFLALAFIGLAIVGTLSPETFVYLGHEVPKKYIREVRSLELLGPEEEIKYFYSDGFLDIKEGLYFVTEDNLVLYCKEWEEPSTIIPFDEIVGIGEDYDDSFLSDSYVTVDTSSGWEFSFPVSSEKGRDRKFVEHIKARAGALPVEEKRNRHPNRE